MAWSLLAVVAIGYLIGAIPFGLIVGRVSRGLDVRKYGSGMTGATNVMRTAGTVPGLVVFALDLGKGVGVVFLARVLVAGGPPLMAGAAALACVVGHNWPIYLRFKGGRGVMTYFGGLLALAWPVVVIGGGVSLVTIALSRYVSLGSLVGAVVAALVMAYMVVWEGWPWEYLVYAAIVTGLIIFQHRDNLVRLWTGRERKIGQKAERIAGEG